jgi:hypothetical protein
MSVDDVQKDAREIYQAYESHFAGHPRATRNLDKIDELIGRLEDVLERARKLQNGGRNERLAAVIERARNNLQTYRREKDAIKEAKSGGEGAVKASRLASWANANFHRYHRHFAGSPRETRDLGLFNAIIDELEDVRGEMEQLMADDGPATLSDDIQTVNENLQMYRSEREQVIDAQQTGTSDEQASFLALRANEQFELYNQLFAGRERVSRSASLLERIIQQLESIGRRMRELSDEGMNAEQHDKNVAIIGDNLSTYREELSQIRQIKQDHEQDTIAAHLGQAANRVFETYREEFANRSRATRSLEALAYLCDDLYHVADQTREIVRAHGLEDAEDNLHVMLENLGLYQREFDEIRQEQQ